VNGLRNRLLHYDVKRGIEEAPEIATLEAFRAFTQRGVRAWSGLTGYLMPLIQRATEDPDGDPPTTPKS
jgi:hypothetical protein